jgi:hypothetical protein
MQVNRRLREVVLGKDMGREEDILSSCTMG